jgi:hypothetical protein
MLWLLTAVGMNMPRVNGLVSRIGFTSSLLYSPALCIVYVCSRFELRRFTSKQLLDN